MYLWVFCCNFKAYIFFSRYNVLREHSLCRKCCQWQWQTACNTFIVGHSRLETGDQRSSLPSNKEYLGTLPGGHRGTLTSFSSSCSPRVATLCSYPLSASIAAWKQGFRVHKPPVLSHLKVGSGWVLTGYLQSQPRKKLWTFLILEMSGSSLSSLLSSSLQTINYSPPLSIFLAGYKLVLLLKVST